MFPNSEIILAISVTDIIAGSLVDGILQDISLVPKHRHDGYLWNAFSILEKVCDAITLGEPALPLPPIKRDSPASNNINFQIAAAKAGLALVKSEYVLRIRSDLIFLEPIFLYEYAAGCTLPRGKASVFEERVMISWLYTLNPYSLERLPLHFSDWFHLGLTRDVIKIWNVMPITLSDAMYYNNHTYLAGTNGPERQFLTKRAVEQYLMYNMFKPHFPQLKLERHNDLRSRELSLDILIDNFIPSDIFRSKAAFNKYNHEFFDKNKRIQCITHETWRELCLSRDETHLSVIQRIAEIEGQADLSLLTSMDMNVPLSPEQSLTSDISQESVPAIAASSDGSFPLRYGAAQLHMREGVRENGEIIARDEDGLVFFGPYISLPNGHYVARIQFSRLVGKGRLLCRVTANNGELLLAEKEQHIARKMAAGFLQVDFSIKTETADNVEVTLSKEGISFISIPVMEIGLRSNEKSSKDRTRSVRKKGKLSHFLGWQGR
ncbi:WavE lipopolysaccharide synthesis family protein [Asaia sp. BMEF1]|uniref:WavE lipopolysaccharide synthesis family protein n=1 Tax=Asaia sp. BMEF1 TaxID=3155932 RepID=UPI003F66DC94